MKGCDAYQIDCEKRNHGALGAEEAVELGEHLKTCAACRHFDETARRLEMMMQANAEQVAGTIDWNQVRGRVDRLKNRTQEALPRIAAGVALFVMLNVWASGESTGYLFMFLSAAFIAGLVMAVSFFHAHWLLREATRAESSPEALFTFYRKEIDRRINAVRMLRVVLPISGLCSMTPLFVGNFSRSGLFQVAVGVMFLAMAAYYQFVSLPRARRERAELA